MTDNVIWCALNSKNKVIIKFPYTDILDNPILINEEEIRDILSFGFSYIEHEDHLLEYIISAPKMIKKIIKEIDDFKFSIEEPFIGTLWTSKVYITDKLKDNQIVFSNRDFSPVLHINLHNME
jgi:hypothetical protein